MKTWAVLLITLGMFGCEVTQESSFTETDELEIRKVIHMQVEAWNSGSLEGFMEGYWKSDSLRFCSSNGTTYGWQKVLHNYQRSFNTKEKMGHLDLQIDSIFTSRHPVISLDGRWIVERSDTIQGHFVLTFEKIENEWKITEDHTW